MTAVSADVTKLAKRENISSMDGSWFFDENFSGVSEDFFDGFIKAVDLPMEDIDENAEEEDWNTKFQFLEPHLDFVGAPVGFCGRTCNDDTEFKKNMSTTSCEGISQLTQFPSVAAKTTRGRSTLLSDDCADNKHMHLIPTSSAVSFPESVGSCSAQFDPKFNKPTKKTRSKRSRSKRSGPATFNPGFPFPCTSSNSTASVNLYRLDASESDLQAFLTEEMLNPAKRKQKKKRNLSQLTSGVMRKLSLEEPGESRETKRCMHCAVTKTPQWREGPLGPKTLCNACGVRYRSGRLFPEYRPAASPTFVASVHSNSHKKVVELRNKACHGATMGIFSSAQ